jgi:cytochrome c553
MRTWEANPPVELPPEVEISVDVVSLDTQEIYDQLCAQCHGPDGSGGIGPSFQDRQFQDDRTDTQLFDSINLGHEATAMIGWGDVLSSEQIQQLVLLIRQFRAGTQSEEPSSTEVSFSQDVLPLFDAECITCHGSLGGWDASSYDSAMESGNNAPVVIPGDAENSLLAQKMLGQQTVGNIMPSAGLLGIDDIQLVIDWIDQGAEDN